MEISKINTKTFRAKCLLTIIAFLNIVLVFFQGGASNIIGQIILGILLIYGNDIVRKLFIFASILGIPIAIFAKISTSISIFKIDLYFVFFILYCIFTFCSLMYNKDILEYIQLKKDKKIKKREERKQNKTYQNKFKKPKNIVLLVIIIVSVISVFFYLTTPVNHINISEDIKNYDLGEGIVFLELNYQGTTELNIDEYWTMEKFDNDLPITAWQSYILTDELVENLEKSDLNFPNIDTSGNMMIVSFGRKLENFYYYKESAYINYNLFTSYIGEPVFSEEYYENTMFIYTSPEYIDLAPFESTDDNIRFNKEGDIPYEVRPYSERIPNDITKFTRSETRLDLILKKLKN